MSSPNSPNSRVQVPIVPGDSFVEPLSGKVLRATSCRILPSAGQDGSVVPCAGGYQSYLDSCLLVSEKDVLEALKELKDSITGQLKTKVCLITFTKQKKNFVI